MDLLIRSARGADCMVSTLIIDNAIVQDLTSTCICRVHEMLLVYLLLVRNLQWPKIQDNFKRFEMLFVCVAENEVIILVISKDKILI